MVAVPKDPETVAAALDVIKGKGPGKCQGLSKPLPRQKIWLEGLAFPMLPG